MKNATRGIIVLVAGLLFVGTALVPLFLYHKIMTATAAVSDASGRIEALTRNEEDDRKLNELFEQTKETRDTLDALAARKDDAAKVIATIEATARTAGVSLDVGGVTLVTNDGPFNNLSLALSVHGTFANTMRFLKLIETLSYISTVESVSMTAEEKGVWTISMPVSVLVHKTI